MQDLHADFGGTGLRCDAIKTPSRESGHNLAYEAANPVHSPPEEITSSTMKHLTSALLTVLCAAFLLSANGQSVIQTAKTPEAGIDYDRLANIDTLINGYVQRGWVRGVVTLIVKKGKVIQHKGYGYSNAEMKKPMKPDDIFRIASQTKAITSAAMLILYDQGRISLHDPVSKYLPGFSNQQVIDTYTAADTTYSTVPAKRGVTIKDLLTHTSGIDYPGIGTEMMKAIYAKANVPTGLGTVHSNLIDEMNRIGKLPLAFQPGTQWRYSLGTDVLGAIIEVVSGMNLEDFMRKNIFEPLGMNDTWFNLPASKADRLTALYTEDTAKRAIPWGQNEFGIDANYPLQTKKFFSGGGGLSATAMDYAIFLQMILNGGTYNGRTILSRRAVEMMLHNQLDRPFDGTNYFGLGFGITSEKGSAERSRNAGSFDWGGFFGTSYWVDPREELVVLFLTQQVPNTHGDLRQKFEQILYGSLK